MPTVTFIPKYFQIQIHFSMDWRTQFPNTLSTRVRVAQSLAFESDDPWPSHNTIKITNTGSNPVDVHWFFYVRPGHDKNWWGILWPQSGQQPPVRTKMVLRLVGRIEHRACWEGTVCHWARSPAFIKVPNIRLNDVLNVIITLCVSFLYRENLILYILQS